MHIFWVWTLMKFGLVIFSSTNIAASPNVSKSEMNSDTNVKFSIKRRWWVEADESGEQTGTPEGKITNLYITFLKNQIINIDEEDNSIQLFIKGYGIWEDDRIKTNFSSTDINNGRLTLPWESITKHLIWVPFAFTRDLLKLNSLFDGGGVDSLVTSLELLTHNPFHENVTLVRAIMQAKYTIACRFYYENYPFDTQVFQYRLMTEPSQRLRLLLHDSANQFHNTQIKLEHLGFDITTTYKEMETNNTNDEVPVTEVGFDMTFKRIYRPFVYQYYIPCIAICMVSSLNFLVPTSSIPGRISLLLTNFLTLTLIYINQMASNPSGTTFTALGKFLLVSMMFGIASIVQFAFVLYLRRHGQGRNSVVGMAAQLDKDRENYNLDKLIDKIDKRSCILFKLAYLVYNLVYWICYLSH